MVEKKKSLSNDRIIEIRRTNFDRDGNIFCHECNELLDEIESIRMIGLKEFVQVENRNRRKKMTPKNPFNMGEKVSVNGYDSTGIFNHSFDGVVVEVDDETCKVQLYRGYHTRVWFGQCILIADPEKCITT